MTYPAHQDPSQYTDAELFRLRKKDESYRVRLYNRIDYLKRDDSWLGESLYEHTQRFLPLVKQMMGEPNELEAVAIVKAWKHEMERLATEQATVEVKEDEDL